MSLLNATQQVPHPRLVGTNAGAELPFRAASVTLVERAIVIAGHRHAVNTFLGIFSTGLFGLPPAWDQRAGIVVQAFGLPNHQSHFEQPPSRASVKTSVKAVMVARMATS
jgi:hypothetical protein